MSVTIPLLIPASCRVSFYASRVTDVTEFSMSNRHFWRFSFCVFSALSSVWDVLENQKFLHISHLSVLCIHTFLPFFFEQGGKIQETGKNVDVRFPIEFSIFLGSAAAGEYSWSGIDNVVRTCGKSGLIVCYETDEYDFRWIAFGI